MKNITLASICVFASTLLSMSLLAAPSDPTRSRTGNPNTIECSSLDGNWELAILLGAKEPLKLTVTKVTSDGFKNPHDMAGLSSTHTAVGTLVSGYDPYLADATQSFTLIIPNVIVSLDNEKQVVFNTKMIESFSGGFWFNAKVLPGAKISNT